MGLGLAFLRLTSQMRCLHFCQSVNSPLRTSRFGLSGFCEVATQWSWLAKARSEVARFDEQLSNVEYNINILHSLEGVSRADYGEGGFFHNLADDIREPF